MHSFQSFQFEKSQCEYFNNDNFPTELRAFSKRLELPGNGTHFGYVQDGEITITCPSGCFNLSAGMYFALPFEATIDGSGHGCIITSLDYTGFFSIGGPVESKGRLRYIDGCTDSLLIAPILKGDPCLNLLYFPKGISQTQHTHPSNRLGMIIRGEGKCITPNGNFDLCAGQIFLIRADGLHSFETTMSDMTVIAYHPDSDFGATHEDHPMINRTIVDGISASQISSIQTQ